MGTSTLAFPVWRGIQGMNALALFLNAKKLSADWHFAAGTRFDQTQVDIVFDNPNDAAPAMVQTYAAQVDHS